MGERCRDPDRAVSEANALLEGIVDTAIDAIVTIDDRGRIERLNRAAERLFGYRESELIGKNVNVLMPEPYHSEHDSYIQNYLQSGEKKIIGIGREVLGRRKDGGIFPLELSVSEVMLGSRRIFTGILRDVTQRKEFEEALQAHARQQEILANVGRRALAGADLEELLEEVCELTARTLDVELTKILEVVPDGKSLALRAGFGWESGLVGTAQVSAGEESQAGFTLLSGEPVIVEDLQKEARFKGPGLLFDHGVVSGISVIILGQTRPYGVFGVHTRRVRHFTREDIYFVQGMANVVGGAIENRKQVKLRAEKESLAKLGEISAMVAHEVKNPIAGIAASQRVLRGKLPEGSFEREIVEEVIKRIMSLNTTVEDILSFARPRNPQKQSVPINFLIEDVIAQVRNDPEFLEVTIEIHGPEVHVPCDVEMLKPVISNILLNAAQAMESRGQIRIDVGRNESHGGRGFSTIAITDTGSGIRPEDEAKLFEPFYTTRGSGTGLGLAIAKRTISLHDGDLFTERPAAGGARFVIRLPLET